MSDVEWAVDFRDYRDVDGVRWSADRRASDDARRHEPEGLTKDQTHGSPGRAPIAMRMPISRVRSETAYAMMP